MDSTCGISCGCDRRIRNRDISLVICKDSGASIGLRCDRSVFQNGSSVADEDACTDSVETGAVSTLTLAGGSCQREVT